MNVNYLLPQENYTVYNALTWGNFSSHRRQARAADSCSKRAFHYGVAALEFAPGLSQITSLFEMAIASCLSSSIEIRPIELEEEEPLSPTQDPASVRITLPEYVDELADVLFPLHRCIDSQYCSLPWPSHMRKIAVMTQVVDGRGDMAAGAKAISLMRKICPESHFDWILINPELGLGEPMLFLNEEDRASVHIRSYASAISDTSPIDFMLIGPVELRHFDIDLKIKGPTVTFTEIASTKFAFVPVALQEKIQQFPSTEASSAIYQSLHAEFFPSRYEKLGGAIPMGLKPGSGVFLDQSLIDAPLSRKSCCPSYLPQIENDALRKDILEAMNVFDDRSEPNYDQYSFNSGYAHRSISREKFIDCVAIHEQIKDVVLVINQAGHFDDLSTEEFRNQVFTKKRLDFLKEKGYGAVILKGENQEPMILQQSENPENSRCFTVIVRPSIDPKDMRRIQLASERLLATGDNSALEAWCARCILYFYEDVANHGDKWRFLQQQVESTKLFSPTLSRLLALFGNDRRLSPEDHYTTAKMEELLKDPGLPEATFQFCKFIAKNYSFREVLEGAIKRAAWHHCMPELADIEMKTLDTDFRIGLIEYLRDPDSAKKSFTLRAIPELGRRIQERVLLKAEDEKR